MAGHDDVVTSTREDDGTPLDGTHHIEAPLYDYGAELEQMAAPIFPAVEVGETFVLTVDDAWYSSLDAGAYKVAAIAPTVLTLGRDPARLMVDRGRGLEHASRAATKDGRRKLRAMHVRYLAMVAALERLLRGELGRRRGLRAWSTR
jgi:hypothetical protein